MENLHKIHSGIVQCRVDFLKKEASIRFDHHLLGLQELVQILYNIGYEPLIQFQDQEKKKNLPAKTSPVLKIAVAGFCFGNIMLLSFPEYFGLQPSEIHFRNFFGLFNILFSIPVVFFCAWEYFQSAWKTLKNGSINLDFPLALGIIVLFLRTLYEILSHTGPGFADTLSGLVFFLLIGKWVQKKTYHHISFERDYRSFFPVAVLLMEDDGEKPIPLTELKTGQRILVRNHEIIPADSILLKGEALIDFSFVTGESTPTAKTFGEIIYAGGKQMGEALELEVIKPVSQSYLTSLWNHEAFKTDQGNSKTFSETIGQYFTPGLLILAISGLVYWFPIDPTKAWLVFSSVLIIACPCALALSTPFTMASALSILDKNHFYLKNTSVVEKMAGIDTLVMDKTGTLTLSHFKTMNFHGVLTADQETWVYSACMNSLHPLSRIICQFIGIRKRIPVQEFSEIPGSGFIAQVQGHRIKIGSSEWILGISDRKMGRTQIHLDLDGDYRGFFSISQEYRKGMENLNLLDQDFSLYLLSGDQNFEEEQLKPYFPSPGSLFFNQSPLDKMNFIETLQNHGSKVLMLGDGLNDSGALKLSDLGVVITDQINNFFPGCDALLEGDSFSKLPAFLHFTHDAVQVIHLSFIISLIYNAVGLSFALSGNLSPLIASILMPLSTITLISFTTLATHGFAKKQNLL